MNRRRHFIFVLGFCGLAAPLAARTQQVDRVRRIGTLVLGRSNQAEQLVFRELLRRLGYEEGRNLTVERRYADGDTASLARLAAELVRLDVELIVAAGNDPVAAARQATRALPIVMVGVAAPVELGFVASLARPGANVTGTAWMTPETSNKVIQVLKETSPRATRIAILQNPNAPGASLFRAENRRAASALGISVEVFDAEQPEHVARSLDRIAASRSDALYVVYDPVIASRVAEIAGFTLHHKLLSIATLRAYAQAGGALCYGPDASHIAERTASYVDRILKGAKPADLPVEQPVKYNLVINLKTTKAIGLTIPQSVLLRADEVIE